MASIKPPLWYLSCCNMYPSLLVRHSLDLFTWFPKSRIAFVPSSSASLQCGNFAHLTLHLTIVTKVRAFPRP